VQAFREQIWSANSLCGKPVFNNRDGGRGHQDLTVR
jgi:hypothetical protein